MGQERITESQHNTLCGPSPHKDPECRWDSFCHPPHSSFFLLFHSLSQTCHNRIEDLSLEKHNGFRRLAFRNYNVETGAPIRKNSSMISPLDKLGSPPMGNFQLVFYFYFFIFVNIFCWNKFYIQYYIYFRYTA